MQLENEPRHFIQVAPRVRVAIQMQGPNISERTKALTEAFAKAYKEQK